MSAQQAMKVDTSTEKASMDKQQQAAVEQIGEVVEVRPPRCVHTSLSSSNAWAIDC